MKERLTEWECSKIANNLDRMESYRLGSGSNTYIGGTDLTDGMSEWEAQRIANNLDRIESYRQGNLLAEGEAFVGLILGVPISIAFVIYFICTTFF